MFKRTNERARQAPRIPDGQRVYAVGDIHGRDDLFAALMARIEADNDARGPATTSLILLGDLIDRGPQSRQAMDRAIALSHSWPRFHWLLGNHEEVFLRVIDGGNVEELRFFLKIGGDTTVNSYGIVGDAYRSMDFAELSDALRQAVPAEHVDFMRLGQDQVRIGDYLFVHAGIRPGIDLDRQQSSDLRWIRQEFLRHRGNHGVMVVHGHTITEIVDSPGNRIGIDTGAYASGILTAIGLEGSERWFLDTASD